MEDGVKVGDGEGGNEGYPVGRGMGTVVGRGDGGNVGLPLGMIVGSAVGTAVVPRPMADAAPVTGDAVTKITVAAKRASLIVKLLALTSSPSNMVGL